MPVPAHDECEYLNRRKRIDPQLKVAGWKVVAFDPDTPLEKYTNHAVTEYPTDNGPADYALFVAGRPLGILEAKKLSLGPQNVLTQAERYSRGVSDSPFIFRGYRVPFLYSTNGEVLWFQDARHQLNRSRHIADFHTPAALEELLGREFVASCGWLVAHVNEHPKLRPYHDVEAEG